MEERGHLSNRFDAESRNPDRELWPDIEARLTRQRKRRPLMIWFFLAGFLLISGGTAIFLHISPEQSHRESQNGSSQPNSATNNIQTPVPANERLSESVVPKNTETHPVLTRTKETQQPNRQKIEAKNRFSSPPKKPTLATILLQKPEEKQKKSTTEPGLSLSKPKQEWNPIPVFKQEKGKLENRKADSLVSIKNNETTNTFSNLNMLVPLQTSEKTNPENVPSEANQHNTETNQNAADYSGHNQPTQPESKIESESEKRIVLNSDSGVSNSVSDTLLKKMVVLADSVQATNDSVRSLPKEPSVRKWHRGLEWTISGIHRELYINQNPDDSRIEVLNPRVLNPERISLQFGGFIERTVSERLTFILKPSLLLIQDRTDANLKIRKLGAYQTRIDQDGNEWFQPMYDNQRIRIRTMKIMAQLSAGLAFHLSKRKSFVLEAGVNRTVFSQASISGADPNDPIFSNDLKEWNGMLRGGFRFNLTQKIGMEPSVTFFLKPIVTFLKGNEITPVLYGCSIRYLIR